jgi:hypothetical protein
MVILVTAMAWSDTGSGFTDAIEVWFGSDTAGRIHRINPDTRITASQPGNRDAWWRRITVDVGSERSGMSPICLDKYTFGLKWPQEAINWSIAVNAVRIWGCMIIPQTYSF